jgi:hypothetical protein
VENKKRGEKKNPEERGGGGHKSGKKKNDAKRKQSEWTRETAGGAFSHSRKETERTDNTREDGKERSKKEKNV